MTIAELIAAHAALDGDIAALRERQAKLHGLITEKEAEREQKLSAGREQLIGGK